MRKEVIGKGTWPGAIAVSISIDDMRSRSRAVLCLMSRCVAIGSCRYYSDMKRRVIKLTALLLLLLRHCDSASRAPSSRPCGTRHAQQCQCQCQWPVPVASASTSAPRPPRAFCCFWFLAWHWLLHTAAHKPPSPGPPRRAAGCKCLCLQAPVASGPGPRHTQAQAPLHLIPPASGPLCCRAVVDSQDSRYPAGSAPCAWYCIASGLTSYWQKPNCQATR